MATAMQTQLELFKSVAEAYAGMPDGILPNEKLYEKVARQVGIPEQDLTAMTPVGQAGRKHNLVKRKVRWHQQTLKHLGLIEKVDGERGIWRLTEAGEKKLRRIRPDAAMLAFSTDLGLAIWGSCERVFSRLDEPIMLAITSPPYPLRKPRAYGNPSEHEYVDFICRTLEPIVRNLARGASVCLNVSNDIWQQGSPARSLYLERMVIALHDRLGLHLMDRIVWHNPAKPPGPIQWASKNRCQLNVAWEPIYWFTNDPMAVRADNRRVLEPHTATHLKLVAAGGEQRDASYSDGAYRLKQGSFGKPTAGRIPRNLMSIGHHCADANRYRKDAAALGMPIHGAPMPLRVADFLIRFLTEPGDLVVDQFGGKLTTGRAAENLGRRWIVCEWIYEYIRVSAERFRDAVGFKMNPLLEEAA